MRLLMDIKWLGAEMPNIENFGQYQYQDQYQVDFFLPILGLVLGLAPKNVPNILEIVLEKGLGFFLNKFNILKGANFFK